MFCASLQEGEGEGEGGHMYLVIPTSPSLRLEVQRGGGGDGGPRCRAQVLLNEVGVVLNNGQIASINKMRSTLRDLERWEAIYRHRPRRSKKDVPRDWWLFLRRCVSSSRSKHRQPLGWLDVVRLLSLRNKYVRLYIMRAQHQATPEDYQEFTRLDDQLTANEIVAFRVKAMSEFSKLQKEELITTLSAERSIAGDTTTPKQTWGQWLLGRPPTRQGSTVLSSREQGNSDVDGDKDVEVTNSEVTLDDDDAAREEFLQAFALGPEEGGEEDGSLDRIMWEMKASLNEGALTMVNRGRPCLRIIWDMSAEITKRKNSWILDLALGALQIFDLLPSGGGRPCAVLTRKKPYTHASNQHGGLNHENDMIRIGDFQVWKSGGIVVKYSEGGNVTGPLGVGVGVGVATMGSGNIHMRQGIGSEGNPEVPGSAIGARSGQGSEVSVSLVFAPHQLNYSRSCLDQVCSMFSTKDMRLLTHAAQSRIHHLGQATSSSLLQAINSRQRVEVTADIYAPLVVLADNPKDPSRGCLLLIDLGHIAFGKDHGLDTLSPSAKTAFQDGGYVPDPFQISPTISSNSSTWDKPRSVGGSAGEEKKQVVPPDSSGTVLQRGGGAGGHLDDDWRLQITGIQVVVINDAAEFLEEVNSGGSGDPFGVHSLNPCLGREECKAPRMAVVEEFDLFVKIQTWGDALTSKLVGARLQANLPRLSFNLHSSSCGLLVRLFNAEFSRSSGSPVEVSSSKSTNKVLQTGYPNAHHEGVDTADGEKSGGRDGSIVLSSELELEGNDDIADGALDEEELGLPPEEGGGEVGSSVGGSEDMVWRSGGKRGVEVRVFAPLLFVRLVHDDPSEHDDLRFPAASPAKRSATVTQGGDGDFTQEGDRGIEPLPLSLGKPLVDTSPAAQAGALLLLVVKGLEAGAWFGSAADATPGDRVGKEVGDGVGRVTLSLCASSLCVEDMYQGGGQGLRYMVSCPEPPPGHDPDSDPASMAASGVSTLGKVDEDGCTGTALNVTYTAYSSGGNSDTLSGGRVVGGPGSRTEVVLGGLWVNWNPETIAALSIFVHGMSGDGSPNLTTLAQPVAPAAAEVAIRDEVVERGKGGTGGMEEVKSSIVGIHTAKLRVWLNKEVAGRRMVVLDAGNTYVELYSDIPTGRTSYRASFEGATLTDLATKDSLWRTLIAPRHPTGQPEGRKKGDHSSSLHEPGVGHSSSPSLCFTMVKENFKATTLRIELPSYRLVYINQPWLQVIDYVLSAILGDGPWRPWLLSSEPPVGDGGVVIPNVGEQQEGLTFPETASTDSSKGRDAGCGMRNVENGGDGSEAAGDEVNNMENRARIQLLMELPEVVLPCSCDSQDWVGLTGDELTAENSFQPRSLGDREASHVEMCQVWSIDLSKLSFFSSQSNGGWAKRNTPSTPPEGTIHTVPNISSAEAEGAKGCVPGPAVPSLSLEAYWCALPGKTRFEDFAYVVAGDIPSLSLELHREDYLISWKAIMNNIAGEVSPQRSGWMDSKHSSFGLNRKQLVLFPYELPNEVACC
ncbi:unnamed protein product [Discosporangium mesarthrocarpum]